MKHENNSWNQPMYHQYLFLHMISTVSTRYWRKYVTGRRGRRHEKLPHDLREPRRYWKLKEKALTGCVWRTRFGRSYGPVADRWHDDDDDDNDDDIRICSRSKVGPWTQWQWDAMGHAYLQLLQLFTVSTPRPHTHMTLTYRQRCIIWQFTASLKVISISLSVPNFTYLCWISYGHMNCSNMSIWTLVLCKHF